jgi:hypothetical protein
VTKYLSKKPFSGRANTPEFSANYPFRKKEEAEGRKPKIHELKCWIEPFEALLAGRKTHEFRKDDRGFKVGDILVLRKWNQIDDVLVFPCQIIRRVVTYISQGPDFGIPSGYVIMSIRPEE